MPTEECIVCRIQRAAAAILGTAIPTAHKLFVNHGTYDFQRGINVGDANEESALTWRLSTHEFMADEKLLFSETTFGDRSILVAYLLIARIRKCEIRATVLASH